jgi:fatty acid desaturase
MDDWIARDAQRFVSRERLRALCRKSDLRGAVQTASHAAAIAVTTTGLIWLATPWTLAPLFIAQGVLINCLYAGQHELSHWTAFRTKAANDAVGQVFGFATLNPFLTDRFVHFAHHRATHDPARDPELLGVGDYTLTSYILDLSGVSFWWRRVTGIVRTTAGRGLEGERLTRCGDCSWSRFRRCVWPGRPRLRKSAANSRPSAKWTWASRVALSPPRRRSTASRCV